MRLMGGCNEKRTWKTNLCINILLSFENWGSDMPYAVAVRIHGEL